MTAINHALTGALIGIVVSNPLIALPAAFVSHFICDALPHFGSNLPANTYLKSNRFRNILIIDASACLILVLLLIIYRPGDWFIPSLCAFLATSPDMFWINEFRLIRKDRVWRPNLYSRLASRIQWFERPIGGFFELAWAGAAIILLKSLVRLS